VVISLSICFVRKSNEAIGKQYVMFAKSNPQAEYKGAGLSVQSNIMFLEEDDSDVDDDTVSVFKTTVDGA